MSSEWQPGQKVFAIGFHKTGTKSLARALRELGLRVHGPAWARDPEACRSVEELLSRALEVVPQFDAFQDNPWPLLWRDLLKRYPDAYFILTTRESSAWLASALDHFGGVSTPMRVLLYGEGKGNPKGNEELYLRRYLSHNAEVREALSGHSRFLELDVSASNTWQSLCTFLGLPEPDGRFPHENTKAERENEMKGES